MQAVCLERAWYVQGAMIQPIVWSYRGLGLVPWRYRATEARRTARDTNSRALGRDQRHAMLECWCSLCKRGRMWGKRAETMMSIELRRSARIQSP